jgi:hypothetical protein
MATGSLFHDPVMISSIVAIDGPCEDVPVRRVTEQSRAGDIECPAPTMRYLHHGDEFAGPRGITIHPPVFLTGAPSAAPLPY